ncbi:MAG TPA: 50S ribosomal protein L15 [Caulobacteraceae bacterium]|nr:50S ribosomal protein L15 [Caulobacteraceae bacterium]
MTKLNELKPRAGASRPRLRVGRGPGSGKGKTAGRGVKGQKSRRGVALGAFEGGQMPLHMRMPKRGFKRPHAKTFAEVNLWRIEKAIAAGKLDPKARIDGEALIAAGVIRRAHDGVRLLAKGALSSKLELVVHSASGAARAAVEKAGGSLTETRPAKEAEPAPQ